MSSYRYPWSKKSRPDERRRRTLCVESLESRVVLSASASVGQVDFDRLDVNQDHDVTESDAQVILEALDNAALQRSATVPAATEDFDVNGDGIVSPGDGLSIVDFLNDRQCLHEGSTPHGSQAQFSSERGSPLLPPQAKFRGMSFEQWNVLQSEWAIEAVLGDPTGLSDTVKGVRFLPGTFGSGEFEVDVTLPPGTPFVSPSYFVFGELYDDLSEDDPEDPILNFILETSDVETRLNGEIVIEGSADELDDHFFGPTYFDEPVFYSEPQPRGAELNAIAARFVVGIGGVYHPLPVGEHTLVHSVQTVFFGDSQITYNITVSPE